MSDDESGPPVPERPLLHGARVWLRPLEARDLPAYVAGINDTEVGGRAGYRMPMSLEQATAWHARTLEHSKSGEGYFFAVCELGDDQFIGTTWLKEINRLDGNAEAGDLHGPGPHRLRVGDRCPASAARVRVRHARAGADLADRECRQRARAPLVRERSAFSARASCAARSASRAS